MILDETDKPIGNTKNLNCVNNEIQHMFIISVMGYYLFCLWHWVKNFKKYKHAESFLWCKK